MRHTIILLLTVLGAGSVFAQAPNLTSEQKAQAKAVFSQVRRDAAPLREELKQNRQALAQAIKSGKSDAEIQQLAAAQGNTMGQLIALRSQALAKFAAQLTPEQKAQIAERKGQFGRQMLRRKLR
jgi:Spy/CpxP family protein refolding chaperone